MHFICMITKNKAKLQEKISLKSFKYIKLWNDKLLNFETSPVKAQNKFKML
jgi:hypothetical protein